MNIRATLEHKALKSPSSPFLVDPTSGEVRSYLEVLDKARTVATGIKQTGAQTGDKIAYALTNSIECANLILGLMYGGYVATAVNLVSGKATIGHVLSHSKSKLVVVEEGTQSLIEKACADKGISPDLINISAIPGPHSNSLEPDENSDGLLMYTSGTTGTPKGVVLTHKALLAGGANTALAHELRSEDRALCVLPLYHINGLCVTIMGTLVSGGSVVIPPKFSVSDFWPTCRAQSCTWFSVVPTQISYLFHSEETFEPIKTLRFGRSASAPLAPDVQRAFEDRFQIPIIETMGLTETAAQILSNPLPPGTRKIGSPGIAFGNKVKIGDEQQNEVPRGTEGELLVNGDNVMRLYLDNPEASSETLTKDGWLRTGDLGKMDADGYVYVTGRLKELIIKGGENIAPREIDDVLYSNPEVIEAAAFAVPCAQYGERVEAAIKVTGTSYNDEAFFLSLCVEKLGKFKAPDRIYFVDDMPKGPSGKIQRLKVAQVALNS